MRIGVVIAVACLAAGSAVNVAVAWWIAIDTTADAHVAYSIRAGQASDIPWAREHLDDDRSGALVIEARCAGRTQQNLYEIHPWRWASKGRTPVDGVALAKDSAERMRSLMQEDWPAAGTILANIDTVLDPPNVRRVSTGWPTRTFESSSVRRWNLEVLPRRRCGVFPAQYPVQQYGVFALHLSLDQWQATGDLPITPIWFGFFCNTVLYATILCLLISGPFVLRHCLRMRRGLCARCAYPRGTTNVCSECGTELPLARPST